jgi:WD40 repeat protein
LWDVTPGVLKTTLQPETGNVFDVAFSTDGTGLLSSSEAGVVYLWQVLG